MATQEKQVEMTFTIMSGSCFGLIFPKKMVQIGLYPPQLANDGIDKDTFKKMMGNIESELSKEKIHNIFPKLEKKVTRINKKHPARAVNIVAYEKMKTPTSVTVMLSFVSKSNPMDAIPVASAPPSAPVIIAPAHVDVNVEGKLASDSQPLPSAPVAVALPVVGGVMGAEDEQPCAIKATCSSDLCNGVIEAGIRYCPVCGEQQADWVNASEANVAPVERFVTKLCVKCSATLRQNQEFECDACIEKAKTVVECVSCAERIPAGSETCTYCESPQMKECVLCGERNIRASSSAFDCAKCRGK